MVPHVSSCGYAGVPAAIALFVMSGLDGREVGVHWELTKVDDIAVHGPPTERL